MVFALSLSSISLPHSPSFPLASVLSLLGALLFLCSVLVVTETVMVAEGEEGAGMVAEIVGWRSAGSLF